MDKIASPLLCKLLDKFSCITKTSFYIEHHITINDYPIHSRSWWLAPAKLRVVEAEFNQMMEFGIICPLGSNWASPFPIADAYSISTTLQQSTKVNAFLPN